MDKFDPTFDYLELLGLTPEAARSVAADQWRPRILARMKELTRQEQNPLFSQESRHAKERLLQFQKLLDAPEALAAYIGHQQEVRSAKKLEHESLVGRLIADVLTSGNALTVRQVEILRDELRSLKIADSVLGDVLKRMKVEIRQKKPNKGDRPVVPRATKAMDVAVLMEVHSWLTVLEKPNLFAFLDLPSTATPAQLEAAAKVLYDKWSRSLPKTSICTAWEKSAQACLTYLKTEDSKERYTRALLNQRIDQFVKRVNLVLAGETFGQKEQEALVRIGMQQFGLREPVAHKCVAARAFAMGVSIERPVSVTVSLDNRVQCRRCFCWAAEPNQADCRNCGTALIPRCANPDCRNVPVKDRHCPKCRLTPMKSRQYARLLELTDSLLDAGDVLNGGKVLGFAEQILAGPETARRLTKANSIRMLLATIENDFAAKAWNKVLSGLQQLAELAPRQKLPGVPQLEKVAAYTAESRRRMDKLSASTDPVDAARFYIACLENWSDCHVAIQRSRLVCRQLIDRKQRDVALELVRKLLESRPRDPELLQLASTLEGSTSRAVDLPENQSDRPAVSLATGGTPAAETSSSGNGHPTAHANHAVNGWQAPSHASTDVDSGGVRSINLSDFRRAAGMPVET